MAFDARIIGRRGIGRYTEALLAGLSNFPDLVIPIPMGTATDRSATPHWLGLRSPGYVLQEQIEYAVRLAGSGCDLVHLTANTAPLLMLRWPPTIVTVHDVMYLMSRAELPLSPSLRQSLGRLYRWVAFHSGTRRVDRLIVDSLHTARELSKRVRHLPPVTVVHPGVDPKFFQDYQPRLAGVLAAKYAIEARHYFLHPAAVDPRKNTRVVLDAFDIYRSKGGIADLVLVGLSEAHRAMLQVSPKQGLLVLPFIPNEDLLMVLRLARGVIYVPSEEGFGYPLVEAMAAGVPAIISKIDVLEEMSANCAWTVRPGDAQALADSLLEFDAQGQRVLDLASKARTRAQAFTTRRMAEDTLLVYQEVVERASQSNGSARSA